MASPLVQLARAIAVDGRRQRVAVFIVPSERGGEELCGLGRRGFTRLLHRLLDESIDPVAIPRLWRFLEALPVNPQGKTSHADLLALLEAPPVLLTEPRSRLLERDAGHALFELVAPPDLTYFNGHFHGQPILAGVVQVDWAIAFGRSCFALPPQFRAIQMLKFQRLIEPDMPFRLDLVYQPASATLTFKISTVLGTHASGRLLFSGADD
jgi:3-hydroxymyristoyl/3-hydroxydecanoyl-(acyl carrier protein) dehydratase